jgi:hypothetical protein
MHWMLLRRWRSETCAAKASKGGSKEGGRGSGGECARILSMILLLLYVGTEGDGRKSGTELSKFNLRWSVMPFGWPYRDP